MSYYHHSKTPMRILLWSPQGSGLHYAGAGTSAFRLYRQDKCSRFDVTLAYANPKQRSPGIFSSEHHIGPFPANVRSSLLFLRHARHWLKANAKHYDLFHGLTGFEYTVGPAFAAKQLGLPAVIKIANAYTDLADKPGIKSLIGLPARRQKRVKLLDGVIATSNAIRAELLSYGIPENIIHLIPNGVDTDLFHPANVAEQVDLQNELGIDAGGRPLVLFCGQISSRKRPHLLIEAIQALPDVALVLVGPVDQCYYNSHLAPLVSQNSIAQRLFIRDHTDEIEKYYRAADIFCLPSMNEGLPNAALEALASGLPLILTRFPGAEDLIDAGRCGQVVESTPDAIADAIRGYLNKQEHEKARLAGLELISKRFSAEKVLDTHHELFKSILANG